VIASIQHNLTRLTDFRGRQTRSQFWPYFAIVVVLIFAALFSVMIPEMRASMERMQRFAVEHPELATIERGPTTYSISIEGYHPELMPDTSSIFVPLAAIVVAAVLLLASAVVRRLHDRGKSGAWALAPVFFLGVALSAMPVLFTQDPPNLALFVALIFNNVLYLASLVWLLVLLAGASVEGAGRFGGHST